MHIGLFVVVPHSPIQLFFILIITLLPTTSGGLCGPTSALLLQSNTTLDVLCALQSQYEDDHVVGPSLGKESKAP